MKAKTAGLFLVRCSRTLPELVVVVQTDASYRELSQSSEPPLRLKRAVEMLRHAYNYVRALDPNGESGAADLLRTKYLQLETASNDAPTS